MGAGVLSMRAGARIVVSAKKFSLFATFESFFIVFVDDLHLENVCIDRYHHALLPLITHTAQLPTAFICVVLLAFVEEKLGLAEMLQKEIGIRFARLASSA